MVDGILHLRIFAFNFGIFLSKFGVIRQLFKSLLEMFVTHLHILLNIFTKTTTILGIIKPIHLLPKRFLTIIVSNDRSVLAHKQHLMVIKITINEVENLR